jgi:peptide/nickel transport system substrate-binding protein
MGTRQTLGLLLCAAVLTACGNGDPQKEGEGGGAGAGPITITLGAEPTTLDPQLRQDANERAVSHNIFEGLMEREADGTLVPRLAATAPSQVDDTTWEFQLRTGVTFTNGEPFNAEAVVYSLERHLDPALKSETSDFLSGIVGAEATDEHVVQIKTEGPDPLLPARMYWLRILPPAAADEPDFGDHPVGTGPYQLVEWRKGQSIVLEPNAKYWNDEVTLGINEATFRFAEEAGTRLSSLLAGESDVIPNVLPEDVDRVPNIATVQGLEHDIIRLNALNGPTADVRVRKALNLAIDRTELAEFLFGGFAEPAAAPFGEATFGYNPAIEPYPFDPDAARALLEEAGVVGETIELIGTAGRWLKDKETVETVAGYWENVGLEVKVTVVPFDEYLRRYFDTENRPMTIFAGHSNELLDADLSLSNLVDVNGGGASNDNQELTDLIHRARAETDPTTRESLYHDILQEAYDQAYFAYLLQVQDIWGLSERVEWSPRVDAKILLEEIKVAS